MKKETYLTTENLDEWEDVCLQGAQSPGRRARFPFELRRAALLVLDMQNYFLDPGSHACVPAAAAMVPRLAALAAAFHQAGRPLVFSRHVNTPHDAGMMGRWWAQLLTREDPLSQIIPAFDTRTGLVLEKSQYDAFKGTELEAYLRRQGVEQVVIGGVMAHLCCESTARGAFMRGFEVFFLVDGTASYTAALHAGTLHSLAHGFAILTGCRQVQQACEA